MDKLKVIEFLNQNKIKFISNAQSKFFSSFKGGGNIDLLALPKDNQEMVKLLCFVNKNYPFLIFGNMSNTLIDDQGYNGLIIIAKNFNSIINIGNKFICSGGAMLNKLITYAKNIGYCGLEKLYSIPATIGGGIIQNCGSFGVEISDYLDKVEVFDFNDNEIKIYERDKIAFDYRKCSLTNCFILNTIFVLDRCEKELIENRIKEVLLKRKETQPTEPSIGSVFKKSGAFSSGYYIEKVGLKGFIHKNCKISEKHANFIVNLGDGTVNDFIFLKNLAKQKVFENFNIVLQEEIIIINNF